MMATNFILQNFITDNEGINGQLTTIETKNRLLTKDFSILNASLFLIKCVVSLLFLQITPAPYTYKVLAQFKT